MRRRLWKSLPRKGENCTSRLVSRVRINITQALVENWATPVARFARIVSLRGRSWSIRRGKLRQIEFLCWEFGEADPTRPQSEVRPDLPHMIPDINGKSWPYTERLTYTAGEPVRWRWINASDGGHPMHMHGSYFRVDSAGDSETDHVFTAEQQRKLQRIDC